MQRRDFHISILKPGDCVLYRPGNVFDLAVALKTWAWVSHVEVYTGDHMSVASRNGKGVDRYIVRADHVAAVLRPGPQFNFDKAMRWFYALNPKPKYGWRTLWTFDLLNDHPWPGHMICSEFAAWFYFRGDYQLFSAKYPFYRVPPMMFLTTDQLGLVWDDGQLFKNI